MTAALLSSQQTASQAVNGLESLPYYPQKCFRWAWGKDAERRPETIVRAALLLENCTSHCSLPQKITKCFDVNYLTGIYSSGQPAPWPAPRPAMKGAEKCEA